MTRLQFLLSLAAPLTAAAPGKSKHIVLISGDEEYRSEEALPQLAKILTTYHGFRCTVLYAIDKKDGSINPNQADNLPGLEALADADLAVMMLRFRDLPDEQMKHIVQYVESGKPIVALRTSTHAFNFKANPAYKSWNYNSKEWDGGFGRQVLGETWIGHHGKHAFESTRGIVVAGQQKHPILRGIGPGGIWGPTDVYKAKLPLPEGCVTLVLGQVLTGMQPTDPPLPGEKNEPMMPVTWIREPREKYGRVFTTTMGSSQDLLNEGFRRMTVNACYWAMGLENRIKGNSRIDIVGEYRPSAFKFNGFIPGVMPPKP